MLTDIRLDDMRQQVWRNGLCAQLGPMEYYMFVNVMGKPDGITVQELFDRQYSHNPNGGPRTGRDTIVQRKRHINEKIDPLGLYIETIWRSRGGGIYQLKSRNDR